MNRVIEMRERILNHPDFVCWPARNALANNRLGMQLIDTVRGDIGTQVHEIMAKIAVTEEFDGGMFVSPDDAESGIVKNLCPPLAPIAKGILLKTNEILASTEGIMVQGSYNPEVDDFVIDGRYIGAVAVTWSTNEPGWHDKQILLTAHGPLYPENHPRYQPYPCIAVVSDHGARKIKAQSRQSIVDKAHERAPRKYNSSFYIIPLTGEREF